MITKPENWKLSYCIGFLQGSAKPSKKGIIGLSETHKEVLNEVANWLIDCVGEEQ